MRTRAAVWWSSWQAPWERRDGGANRFLRPARRSVVTLNVREFSWAVTPRQSRSRAGSLIWLSAGISCRLGMCCLTPRLLFTTGHGHGRGRNRVWSAQVVVPRVFAQPHNAEWLRRLGLCLVLDSHAYTASQGSAAVREVVGNPRYRSTAQSYAPRCDSEGGLRSACEYLESPSVMAESGQPHLGPMRDGPEAKGRRGPSVADWTGDEWGTYTGFWSSQRDAKLPDSTELGFTNISCGGMGLAILFSPPLWMSDRH